MALVGDLLIREDIVDASFALNEETPPPFRFDLVDRDRLENRELVDRFNRV